MKQAGQRNGKIELMRFVFCMCIIVMHVGRDIWGQGKVVFEHFSLMNRAYCGVEFFFLVSGYLMARSIYRKREAETLAAGQEGGAALTSRPRAMADEVLQFLWHKVRGILPYHFAFSAIVAVEICVFWPEDALERILTRIPGLFYLQMFGFTIDSFVQVEWYVSSMLIAMAILYPICKRYYTAFTHLFGPVAAFCLLGYMYVVQGKLSGPELITGVTFQGNWRALAELSLGMSSFEVCRWMQGRTFTRRQRGLLSLAEGAGYGGALLYACSTLSAELELTALLFLWVAVTISFSQQGLLGESRLFQNPVCLWLGAVSLPVYLCQNPVRHWFNHCCKGLRGRDRFLLTVAVVLVVGVCAYGIRTALKKRQAAKRISG
ncbi:MAG: acyltransferase family protein [Clostridiales bacterium]|nr:acyltransferase family protein [Clostridiales bacterium]